MQQNKRSELHKTKRSVRGPLQHLLMHATHHTFEAIVLCEDLRTMQLSTAMRLIVMLARRSAAYRGAILLYKFLAVTPSALT